MLFKNVLVILFYIWWKLGADHPHLQLLPAAQSVVPPVLFPQYEDSQKQQGGRGAEESGLRQEG